MDLDDVRIFTKVVEAKSFTKAAAQLGMPKSTVSRRVANLEDHLDVRLLQRTTRKLTLTHAGELYFTRTARVIEELQQAELALEDLQKDPRGLLRLTVPSDMRGIAARLIAGFQELYPLVEVAVFATGRRVDLVAEGYDLAFRAGVLTDSSFISRKLLDAHLGIFGSPSYLKTAGIPRTLAQVKDHPCLIWGTDKPHVEWTLSGPRGPESVSVSGPLASNDFDLLISACAHGMGLALLPTFQAAQAGIERVLPKYLAEVGGLYAVYPSARHLSPKVRAFIDFSSRWMSVSANLVEAKRAAAPTGAKSAVPKKRTRK